MKNSPAPRSAAADANLRLAQKVALITGGAQGIGLAIAQRFFAEGATVFIADVNAEAGKQALAQFAPGGPGQARFVQLDVTSEPSWIEAFAEVMRRDGRLDILVNNAGINIRQPIEEMEIKNLDAMLAVNVRGPFIGIKHALPLLRQNGGGSIINMASICGLVGHKFTPEAYTTTKGALTLLTKSVAVRYAKDNIRANSIHPSTVDTPLVREFLKDPAKKQQRLDEVPLGRFATTDDVAAAAVFLASDEGAFLNGVALPVDGGLTAY